MMVRTLVEEGLVTGEVKFPTQLTLLEKGYSLLRDQAVPAAPSPASKAPVIEEPTPVATQPSKLDGLHPRVLGVAKRLFEDGHYRSAVLDTYVALDNDVQLKSRLQHVGTELMQKAFTINNKKGTTERATILKVAGGDDPQQGTMWLFSGAVMGIRNVLAHDYTIHPTEQEALEQLYFASMLFSRLDRAMNVEAEQLIAEITQLSFKLDGNNCYSYASQIRGFLASSSDYVDAELQRICFGKIFELIKSTFFNDQNVGIDLLLELDSSIFELITFEEHIELICAIYKTICGKFKSHSALALIEDGFEPITKSLKLFQNHLLSSDEALQSVLKKIECNDDFLRSITHNSGLEFMVAFLQKVVDNEFVLRRNDLSSLSYELNRVGKKGLEELTEKINTMNEELYK
ncbi:TIGR02391 family protein [Paenibacillus pabuli]|uniref:TIGR02391 family protein n=1 Tax=Paenibacillus pabuli TaxID=1472 RepID=UPI000783FFAD|nr:TIGR02391 family protein [Paenibacillus pabuli]MEC0125499.1 TIGR02391 family protein [Paenibacillus pabuli]